MAWFRVMAWSWSDLFCSVAADLLVLHVAETSTVISTVSRMCFDEFLHFN